MLYGLFEFVFELLVVLLGCFLLGIELLLLEDGG